MGKEIKLANEECCTGCGACKAICPKAAIQFIDNPEGFPSPLVDAEKCISCGACTRACPALNKPELQEIKECYAVQSKDRETLMRSTSGAMFAVFAEAVFKMEGIVYGCVWDEEYNAVFHKAENKEQLLPMHGSKYVWSWAGDSYPDVKRNLHEGRHVLFAGLPCQVAGLRKYLGKEYENLITLDFFCSGAPSPIVFKSWLETIRGSNRLSELNLKFRDKNPNGVGVNITYKGSKPGKKKGQHITNPYYYSFYTRLIDRLSCYQCQYGSDMRVSDLTLGDYWGVANYHPNMNIRDGISVLLINTEKGKELFESVRENVFAELTMKENIARANNLSIGKLRPYHKPEKREAFIQRVTTDGWKSAEREYLYDNKRAKLWLRTQIPDRYKQVIKRLILRK